MFAIPPDIAVGQDAIELDPHPLALCIGRDLDLLAIPCHAGRKPPAGAGGRCVFIETSLDAPIVRDVEFPPLRIIEAGKFSALCLPLMERPCGIEGNNGSRG